MDPVSLPPSSRPPIALQADLAAVLREGQVLAGEVAQRLDGSSILIALGRLRVPAEGQVDLNPGDAVLVRVESTEGGLRLRILGEENPAADSLLLRALRGVVASDRPVGELLGLLAAKLRASLAGGETTARLQGGLHEHVFQPGSSGADLARLVGKSGLGYEAALLAAAQVAGRGMEFLSGDLKALLLRALAELPEGELRQAVARTLGGLEAEQLLNLARREAGEPLHLSLPVPDGEGYTTLHLYHHPPRREPEEEGEGEAPRRLVVAVRFSQTGPVRADLALLQDRLHLRVLVETESLAERLRTDLGPLVERLDVAGRSVSASVGVAEASLLEPGENPLDVRYLREHRLMDVRG